MNLIPGAKLGAYEIVSKLGAGGMGEVYRARDTRLDREVAIKVLPADFANDADRLRRFEQEARATSALNHPNILTVYDIGNHEGAPYIVAELLEGEELREELNGGTLPVRKAIDCAQQITAGLAAAHNKGIVHRDLKPENLFVTKDGRIKILDFGLAKVRMTGFGSGSSDVATQKQMTDPGTVMGTVGYMSPEQVHGKDIDHRSDIFSFGLILYEMLAGQRAFEGDSAAALMSAILRDEPPDLAETNAKISPALDKIVRRCLEKKPENRFQTASDLGFALGTLSVTSSSGANRTESVSVLETPSASKSVGVWRERVWMILAGVFFLALLTFCGIWFSRPVVEAEPMWLSINAPEKMTRFDWPVVSPDGRTLAFIAGEMGKPQLWVRPLSSASARVLLDADHPNNGAPPFWSYDGRFLAFVSDRKLKKIALSGGVAETLCEVSSFRGGTWNQNGVILFADSSGDIKRVADNGGAVSTVLKADATKSQRFQAPLFLPDGRNFIFTTVFSGREQNVTNLASLEGGEIRELRTQDGSNVALGFSSSAQDDCQLVYVLQGTLQAQKFDLQRKKLEGEPARIAPSVYVNNSGFGKFSMARNGLLVLMESQSNSQFAWFDRTGKRLETVGQPGRWLAYRVSPDGQRLVAERLEGTTQNADLRVLDITRGADTRFTFDKAHDNRPIWSPDGSRIAWASNRDGQQNLYWKSASGAGQDELLLRSEYSKIALDWSTDGRFLLYQESHPESKSDLWVLSLDGARTPWPWLKTPFAEANGQFAPDGKWIAYQSDESGSSEIYVQAFAPGSEASGSKSQLSTNGGTNPTWRRDGRELYFISPDGKLMAVDMNPGAMLKFGTPRELFSTRGLRNTSSSAISVTRDGQRFLFGVVEATGVPPITVLVNWMTGSKK